MLTKEIAAARVARELPDAEHAIDAALEKAANLMQSMMLARSLPDVPNHAGQVAIIRLAKACEKLVEASSDMIRVHGDLRKVNQEIRMMPDENGECPWPAVLNPGALADVA